MFTLKVGEVIIDSHLQHKNYLNYWPQSDAYLGPYQTSVMELFWKLANDEVPS